MDSESTNSKKLRDKVKIEAQNIPLTENPFCKLPPGYLTGGDPQQKRKPGITITPWEKSYVPTFPPTDDRILPQS